MQAAGIEAATAVQPRANENRFLGGGVAREAELAERFVHKLANVCGQLVVRHGGEHSRMIGDGSLIPSACCKPPHRSIGAKRYRLPNLTPALAFPVASQ